MAVSDWDTTAANNTTIGGINIGEGCDPANINNAIRELMSQVATGPLATALGSASLPAFTFRGDLNTGMWSPGADEIAISTGGAERVRLTSSVLLAGKTSATTTTVGCEIHQSGIVAATRSGSHTMVLNRLASDGSLALFQRSDTTVGSISVTTTATAYNTSSDYRLKTVTGPVSAEDARAFIMALQPKKGTWKVNDTPFCGFLAHEFQAVSPTSVNGEHDAVDGEGNPVYQSMDAGTPEVIANLVALVQSLTARLEALEA